MKNNQSTLFANKANTLAALDKLIDKSILPQGPTTNRVWEKTDQRANLVFLQNNAESPLGKRLDAIEESHIVIDGVKFYSIASVWAFVSHTTDKGETDDQLRTRFGPNLLSYLTNNIKSQRFTHNNDYNHQWSVIMTALIKNIVTNVENFCVAIEQHGKKYGMSNEDMKSIEFIVPVSSSKFSKMYEEAVNLAWPYFLKYCTLVNQKKKIPFENRIDYVVTKAFENELIHSANKQSTAAGVDESWFKPQAFIDSIISGVLKFHTEQSVLTKLWANSGVEGFNHVYSDWLLACGMMRRHHGWIRFDFESNKPEKSENDPFKKVTIDELKELINNPVYKDWIIDIHINNVFDGDTTVETPLVAMPKISELFTDRNWQILRSVVLFNQHSMKTRHFFDEETLKLLDAVCRSDIQQVATGPNGYSPAYAFGASFKATDDEILFSQAIISKLCETVLESEEITQEQVKADVAEFLKSSKEQGLVTQEEADDIDPTQIMLHAMNIYIPTALLEELQYRPKKAYQPQQKPWNKNR